MGDPSPLSNTTVGTPGFAVPDTRTFSLWPPTSTSVFGAAAVWATCRSAKSEQSEGREQQSANTHGHDLDSELERPEALDGFELTLQFNCLPLPSTPDDDQRHAGRAHEQHQTFRVKLTGGEPRIGRERCDDRHLENCHRDQEPLWQRRCQIALAFEQRALKDQAWQIDGRTEQSSAAAPIHLPCHPNGDEQTGDADQPEIGQKPDHSKPRRPADSGG